MGLLVGYVGFVTGALYGNWVLMIVALLVCLNELSMRTEEEEE